MPHFLVIFTIRKITNTTITKVMSATRKSPTLNIWPVYPVKGFAVLSITFPLASRIAPSGNGGMGTLKVEVS